MDEIIKEVQTARRGFKLGKEKRKIICYADNAVIMSEDEDYLQRMLYKFEKTVGKLNMTISVQKTESLTISKEPRRCKLAVYNKSVNQVMRFEYLGVIITSNRNLEEEVREQATKASIISGYLKDIIWRNKHMSIKGKVRIYKTCVRPIMTYTAETRAESAISKCILRITEMMSLRAIIGNSLRDRRRNRDKKRM
ncbi:uncharacterized protein LOC122522555 [Polistes fuscatus]|uniref:uncharacterized protein LOC122522555 n=1 Tax=Polistes fuscatus TaxID=30207 RepID=UPI001CA9FD1A|nr:uncharacterized protein LOC122522555 [Polistes fuscatus]